MDGHPAYALRYLGERKGNMKNRVILELEHVF
jgi:hypothetical protein